MFNHSLILTEKIPYPDKGDTNLLIAESVRRYPTFACRPEELIFENGDLFANAHKVFIRDNGELAENEERVRVNVCDNAVVNIRLNPPFDSRYFTAMHMLNYARETSLVVNDPISVVSYPEKFIPKALAKFMPETIITSNASVIKDFWDKHDDIILKPLYEFAGRSVFRINKKTENFKSIFQLMKEKYNEPIIAQKYIPEIRQGDKRIFLIDGEVIGAYNRIPPEGQLQAAIAQGGTLAAHKMTDREKEICAELKPLLQRDGIIICGLDVIGDYLTEINVTCPAGFSGINKLYKIESEKLLWDKLEEIHSKNSYKPKI